jgi:hypothetical protein
MKVYNVFIYSNHSQGSLAPVTDEYDHQGIFSSIQKAKEYIDSNLKEHINDRDGCIAESDLGHESMCKDNNYTYIGSRYDVDTDGDDMDFHFGGYIIEETDIPCIIYNAYKCCVDQDGFDLFTHIGTFSDLQPAKDEIDKVYKQDIDDLIKIVNPAHSDMNEDNNYTYIGKRSDIKCTSDQSLSGYVIEEVEM